MLSNTSESISTTRWPDPVRIGFLTMPPWTFECACDSRFRITEKCLSPGSDAEIVGSIFSYIGIDVECVNIEKPPWNMGNI